MYSKSLAQCILEKQLCKSCEYISKYMFKFINHLYLTVICITSTHLSVHACILLSSPALGPVQLKYFLGLLLHLKDLFGENMVRARARARA